MDYYVPDVFREWLLDQYPALASHTKFLRLVGVLLYSTFQDDETGRTVLDLATFAGIERKTHLLRHNNYSAQKFLAEVQDVLPELVLKDAVWEKGKKGKAREVINDGLGKHVHQKLEETLIDNRARPRVSLETGRRRTRSTIAVEDDRQLQLARERVRALSPNRLTRDVITYHNDLPRNTFSKAFKDNADDAYALLSSLEGLSHRTTLRSLDVISHFPKPILMPSQNTARAFSSKPSLMNLRRECRAVITRGWKEYDLQSVQLASAAREWRIESLLDVLQSQPNVWVYLMNELNLDASSKSLKQKIKDSIYALVFGAAKNTIAIQLGDLYQPFFSLPLIQDLWLEREKQIGSIVAVGGAEVPLKGHVKIPSGLTGKRGWEKKHEIARSILAQQMQAIEMILIHPIYELARSTTQFTILLYQFDGISIKYRDNRSKGTWEKRIMASVTLRAKELKIPTTLVAA